MESESEYCKVEVIAEMFGVTSRRIQQLTQDGVLETTKTDGGRRYELKSTVKKYIKYLSDKAYGREEKTRETELKEQKLKAEIALKESQGELHQLRTAIASGKYISKEEVQLDYQRFFVVFRKFALAIPPRVSGMIAGFVEPVIARGIEKDLNKDISAMLNTFVVSGTEAVDE